MNPLLLLLALATPPQTASADFESYRAHIAAASAAAEAGDSLRALAWLDGAPAKHRGWEWEYLRSECDASLAKFHAGAAVTKIQVSPDGKTVAVATSDGTVGLFDSATRKRTGTLKGHTNAAYWLDFSPDGKTLATTSRDFSIRLWDTATASEIGVLGDHPTTPYACAFTPDGKRIVSVGWRMHPERKSPVGLIRVWDVAARAMIHDQDFTTHPISSLDFSSDGKTCYIGTWEEQLLVFDMEKLAVAKEWLPKPSAAYKAIDWVEVDPEGGQLITACKDKTVKFFDLTTGEATGELPHRGHVTSARFSRGGQWIVTSSQDGAVRVWDAKGKREVARFMGHGLPVTSVAVTPDGTRAFSGDASGQVLVWNVAQAESYRPSANLGTGSWSCVFSPDGTKIAAGSNDRNIKVQDASTLAVLQELPVFDALVVDVAWSPDGKRVVGGSNDGTVRAFDLASGTQVWRFNGKGQMRAADWSRDGRLVAAGDGSTGVAYLLDAASGAVMAQHAMPAGTVNVAFAHDSKRVAFASGRELALVDSATGKVLASSKGLASDAIEVAFSPDGKTVAVGGTSGHVELFDAATGVKRWSAKTVGSQWGVHFSPDGKRIASTGYDFAMHLWDPATGLEVFAIRDLPEQGFDVRFSKDGNRIAYMSASGTTTVIDKRPYRARGNRQP